MASFDSISFVCHLKNVPLQGICHHPFPLAFPMPFCSGMGSGQEGKIYCDIDVFCVKYTDSYKPRFLVIFKGEDSSSRKQNGVKKVELAYCQNGCFVFLTN